MSGDIGPGVPLILVLWILAIASAVVFGAWAAFFMGFPALAEWFLAKAGRIRKVLRPSDDREVSPEDSAEEEDAGERDRKVS